MLDIFYMKKNIFYMVKKKCKKKIYKNGVFNNTPLDSHRSKSLIKFSIFVWFDIAFDHTLLYHLK